MTEPGQPTTMAEALVQLNEARQTLSAIESGEVDAFLISPRGEGHRVVTLSTFERPYWMFVEHMRDGAATVSPDGRIMYANGRLADLLATPRSSIVGESLERFIAGDPPAGWRALGGDDPAGVTVELDLLDARGAAVPVLVGASPLPVDGEQMTCLTFTDLSAQRAQEREISRLNDAQMAAGLRFTAVVEALQEGVLVQDEQGRVLEANHTASVILGSQRDRLVTTPPSPLSWTGLASTLMPIDEDATPGRRALATGEPVLGVMLAIERGDDTAWLEINSVPVRLPGERETPVVISSFRDVTARVAADEAIRFQALLLDTAGQAIIAVDGRGRVVYWNKHAEQMYGWKATEAVGRDIADMVFPAGSITHGPDTVEGMPGFAWSGDRWAMRRDGTRFPIFATSTPSVDDSGNLVATITVATDITDRKRAEDQARRLTAIVESSSDAIIGMTLDHVITTWNTGAVALFGYDIDEAVGRSFWILVVSSGRAQSMEQLRLNPEMPITDVECCTKSGAVVRVSLGVSPILDEDGRSVGLSAIGRDVTERIALEQIAVKSQQDLLVAQHAAELEALGRVEANRANRAKSEFLSRMSHELRTPLNSVLGFGQILLLDDLSADQRESVGFICRAGEHLLALIDDVLDISRIEAGALRLSLEPVQLSEVVTIALSLIRPQAAQRNIAMSADAVIPDDVFVLSDRQRLLQIILNMLSNAVKYNRQNGSIELSCESTGGSVAIAVTDTGLGISPVDLGKLFTPFERLGAEGSGVEGTGVGLALSRTLSEEMGGSLTVSSTLGTGSTFTLELPVGEPRDGMAIDDGWAPVVGSVGAKPLTILAIEDNVANIRLLERIVRECDNVHLLTAIQGRLGLELAARHRPGLILLDMHLPDIHGERVLDALKADPATAAIPVAICSGDASPTQRRRCFELGASAYLTKPFDLAQMFELFEQTRRSEVPAATHPPAAPA